MKLTINSAERTTTIADKWGEITVTLRRNAGVAPYILEARQGNDHLLLDSDFKNLDEDIWTNWDNVSQREEFADMIRNSAWWEQNYYEGEGNN